MTSKTIQVVTHCDPQRAIRATMLAHSSPPELEVICAVNGPMEDVLRRMRGIPIPDNLTFIAAPHEQVYPANSLRNQALMSATAEWIIYIDTDFVFCNNLVDVLIGAWHSLQKYGSKICLCPVALWDPCGKYLTTSTTCELIDNETFESHRPPRSWSEARMASLFKFHKRCFQDPFTTTEQAPYEITECMLRFRYSFRPTEPWGLLRRENAVLADEDFGAGPMDKQQFVCALLDHDIRFFAVPKAFLFHMWHPERFDGWPDRARSLSLWLRRHSMPPRRFLLIGIGNVLPPHLHSSLQQYVDDYDSGFPFSSNTKASTVKSGPLQGQHCVNAMKAESPVITGPQYLPRAVLGLQYRVCLFFHSPAFYRLHPEFRPDNTEDQGDGTYLLWIVGLSSLTEAASRIENVALLCDVSNRDSCIKKLQNLVGIRIPDSWLREWEAAECTPGSAVEATFRRKYPRDYCFYDFMRVLGRSC